MTSALKTELSHTLQDKVNKTYKLRTLTVKSRLQNEELQTLEDEEQLLLMELEETNKRLNESQDVVEGMKRERVELLAIRDGLPKSLDLLACNKSSVGSVTNTVSVSNKSKSGIERNFDMFDAKNRLSVVARCVGRDTEQSIEAVDDKHLAIKGTLKAVEKLHQFDKVFGCDDTQDHIFRYLQDGISQSLECLQMCIIGHGGLQSGKSSTLFGSDTDSSQGLVFQTLKLISEKILRVRDSQNFKQTFSYSFTEIYCDKLFNLLDERKPELVGVPYVRNEDVSKEFPVDKFVAMIKKGRKRRVVSKSSAGQNISRSHTILTFTLRSQGISKDGELEHWGSITFVDLASPEKNVDFSDMNKKLEHAFISKSWSQLHTVLKALKSNSPHIPYRSNKLTSVLQPCLSKCAKCIVIMHLQTSKNHSAQTKNSLEITAELQERSQTTTAAPTGAIQIEEKPNHTAPSWEDPHPPAIIPNIALTPRDQKYTERSFSASKLVPAINLNKQY